MNTQWLFFDLGSTLIDETKAYEHRIYDAIEGTNITIEEFNEKRKYFAMQNLRGDLEALAYFGLKRTPWHSEDEYPYPDTARVLDYLYNRGYKLGVIANQPIGTEDRLRSWDLLKYFTIVVASAELGIAKPDKDIFLKALELSYCTPEKAAMIGDRLDNDIYPALELGMITIWIKQGMAAYQQLDAARSSPDHIIGKLSELTGIF
jgi:putative hydrolase of the HAD superfamily